MNRCQAFRESLYAPALTHAMASHNPLSAKLAERAGFHAIWGSGFELSASYAVPDASILPMSVHLEMMRAICDTVTIPVIADIDTGFGNAVNVRHAVPLYEKAGVSAVVMEDKSFPKQTSLRKDGRQELVRIEEFQGKIAAACAARNEGSFTVIARTEALIAGAGIGEAIRRGLAYVDAGADALLIHSKQTVPNEIVEFAGMWPGKVPLVLVPTSYPRLTESDIHALGNVGLVIYGNHAIRAAVGAMQAVFAQIRRDGGIATVDASLPSVASILELQGDEQMREVEARFLR